MVGHHRVEASRAHHPPGVSGAGRRRATTAYRSSPGTWMRVTSASPTAELVLEGGDREGQEGHGVARRSDPVDAEGQGEGDQVAEALRDLPVEPAGDPLPVPLDHERVVVGVAASPVQDRPVLAVEDERPVRGQDTREAGQRGLRGRRRTERGPTSSRCRARRRTRPRTGRAASCPGAGRDRQVERRRRPAAPDTARPWPGWRRWR